MALAIMVSVAGTCQPRRPLRRDGNSSSGGRGLSSTGSGQSNCLGLTRTVPSPRFGQPEKPTQTSPHISRHGTG